MLQSIRDKATGPLAWVIVGIISVPFAFFGIEAFRSGGPSDAVAHVNGDPIQRFELENQVDSRYARFQQMLGENFDPAMFNRAQLRSGVLEELIDQEVLRQYLAQSGHRISNAQVADFIAGQSSFQDADGNFDAGIYRDVLARQGRNAAQYEEQVRTLLALRQFENLVQATSLIAPQELAARWAEQRQTRSFHWRHYPLAAFQSDIEISEEALQQAYEARKDSLMTPERLRVDYLVLDPQAIAQTLEVSEEELQAAYESDIARYRSAESRSTRHILLEDRKAAAGLRERIQSGEIDFAAAAREYSQDPGSKEQGGDLGPVSRGVMVPPFEEAVFSAEVGELSEPVETDFGWHLIEVTAISGGETKPFAEVRDEIESRLRDQRARERVRSQREELDQLVFENPASLMPAARALDLELQTSEWFTRSGGAGITADPAVIEAAFSEPVLEGGENSPLLNVGDRVVAVRVTQRQIPRAQELDEVRDMLLAQLREKRALAAQQEAIEADREALEAGTEFAALPERAGVPAYVDVSHTRGDGGLDRNLVSAVFATAEEQTLGEATLTTGQGRALFALQSIEDGDWSQASETEREQLRQQVQRQVANAELQALIAALRDDADVSIRQRDPAEDEELPL